MFRFLWKFCFVGLAILWLISAARPLVKSIIWQGIRSASGVFGVAVGALDKNQKTLDSNYRSCLLAKAYQNNLRAEADRCLQQPDPDHALYALLDEHYLVADAQTCQTNQLTYGF